MAESKEGVLATSKISLSLDLPPSCIEFCPEFPSYFVVGTYNLRQDEPAANAGEGQSHTAEPSRLQSRNGSLVVFTSANSEVKQVQMVSQPSAILDLHFCPLRGKQDILAVVSSSGTLAIFQLVARDNATCSLQHLATSGVSGIDESALLTSVAWCPKEASILAVTVSSGEVMLLHLDEMWTIVASEVVITHSLEAWTVAFSAEGSSQECPDKGDQLEIYSGGDDSTLRYASLARHDPGQGGEVGLRPLYPAVRLGEHTAGVTAILPTTCQLSDGFDVVITGSYDDSIRVFAIQRSHLSYGARKARLLAEKTLGGGVWRLKMVQIRDEGEVPWSALVLVSCMHAGARVVRISGAKDVGIEWEIQTVGRFEEHQSMNYGSDIVPGTPASQKDSLVCVSTSFYDKFLALWVLPL